MALECRKPPARVTHPRLLRGGAARPDRAEVDAGGKKGGKEGADVEGSEAPAVQLIIQGSPHPGTFLSNQVGEEGLFIYIEMAP